MSPANSFPDQSLSLDSVKAADCIRRAARPVSALRARPFATSFAAGRGCLSVFLLVSQESRSDPVVTRPCCDCCDGPCCEFESTLLVASLLLC